MDLQRIDESPERRRLRRLADSVAPAIHGHHCEKKSLLLMLIGGITKEPKDGGRRGNIHVCLCGGPQSAKSSFLQWAARILPQSVCVSGASSTAAGLTAAVVPEEESSIAPGALMQASGGVCCIDNFELLEERAQNSVRDVMDQQAIMLSKAGLQAKLRADTSVLASYGTEGIKSCAGKRKWNDAQSRSASVSAHVLNAFDLVLRSHGEDDDEDTARHILRLAMGRQVAAPVTQEELQGHIRRAQRVEPSMSAEAEERLTNCYLELRRSRFGATPRHLESLVRLSEAVARACLQEEVSVVHVSEAFELLKHSVEAAAKLQEEDSVGPMAGRKRRHCAGA
eukprot:TRINITY_DN49344_c0_g1_i1.p1 TRINITY_DN49344_c0_g1~~TRINITY_DN49344_c0_g1_i1.p1  ORF type:complete len:339 (-),score=65.93 TRINITY_DN49344_c0_g1_i1:62-1078(-)